MFGMYALITWFGGLELASCRSTFDEFLKAFFAVLFSVMGLAQASVGVMLPAHLYAACWLPCVCDCLAPR
jgi:hypothetical protein